MAVIILHECKEEFEGSVTFKGREFKTALKLRNYIEQYYKNVKKVLLRNAWKMEGLKPKYRIGFFVNEKLEVILVKVSIDEDKEIKIPVYGYSGTHLVDIAVFNNNEILEYIKKEFEEWKNQQPKKK